MTYLQGPLMGDHSFEVTEHPAGCHITLRRCVSGTPAAAADDSVKTFFVAGQGKAASLTAHMLSLTEVQCQDFLGKQARSHATAKRST